MVSLNKRTTLLKENFYFILEYILKIMCHFYKVSKMNYMNAPRFIHFIK